MGYPIGCWRNRPLQRHEIKDLLSALVILDSEPPTHL